MKKEYYFDKLDKAGKEFNWSNKELSAIWEIISMAQKSIKEKMEKAIINIIKDL